MDGQQGHALQFIKHALFRKFVQFFQTIKKTLVKTFFSFSMGNEMNFVTYISKLTHHSSETKYACMFLNALHFPS